MSCGLSSSWDPQPRRSSAAEVPALAAGSAALKGQTLTTSADLSCGCYGLFISMISCLVEII